MIAGKNAQAADVTRPVVTERMSRNRRAKGAHRGLVRNRSQRDNCLQILKPGQHRRQELPAIVDLRADGFVFRWYAAHRIDDTGIHQAQTIVGTRFKLTGSKSKLTQRAVEKVASIIAGKRSPGPVGAT